MDEKELIKIMEKHKEWLKDNTKGCRANLRGADLRGANLRGAKTDYLTIGPLMACPETGAFEAWKKVIGDDGKPCVIKLLIPARAKRSSATTRKCRAEYVKVLQGKGKTPRGGIYKKGKITRCDNWDDNRWNECSGGIHFFMNKADAESWVLQ